MEQSRSILFLILILSAFIFAKDKSGNRSVSMTENNTNQSVREVIIGPSNTDLINWKNNQEYRLNNPQKQITNHRGIDDISELIPLNTDNILKRNDFDLANSFDTYIYYYRDIVGQFKFEGLDSLGVWFRPREKCKIKTIEVLFCDDGDNENLGQTFNIRLFDVRDTLEVTDSLQYLIPGNGSYEFFLYNGVVPSPTGRLLGEYQMQVTQTGYNEATGWSVINLEDFGEPIDVGKRDFFIAFQFPEGNTDDADVYYGPSQELHYGEDYHSFKWYHDGGTYSPGLPNWVSRLNFSVRVKVDYADIPPPIISPDRYKSAVYNSCVSGTYGVALNVPWVDTLEQTISAVYLVYYTDNILEADTVEITDNRSIENIETIYYGEIPSHPVGSRIWYYFIVENITQIQTRYLKSAPAYIQVLETTEGAHFLVLDDGPHVNISRYTDVFDTNIWKYDVWDLDELGSPDLCILEHYTSLIWLQGQATGGMLNADSLDVKLLPQYLDNGGNLLLVSSDYLGAALGYGFYPALPLPVTHPFIAEYLKVYSYYNDANIDNSGYSSDSLYLGVEGNLISGFLGTDTLILTPVMIDGYNFADEVVPTDDALSPFSVYSIVENNWITASTMYESNFKMVFLPWALENAADQSQFEQVIKNIVHFFEGGSAVSENPNIPTEYALKQNFPNPFNPVTSITFEIPNTENIQLTVYNLLGLKVRTLVNDNRAVGRYTIIWDGCDDNGQMVGSGVYFYRIQAGSYTKTAKMVYLK